MTEISSLYNQVILKNCSDPSFCCWDCDDVPNTYLWFCVTHWAP